MLSVDLEGRDRRLFTDVEFALRSSRHVNHPSLFQLRQIRKDVLSSPAVVAAIKQFVMLSDFVWAHCCDSYLCCMLSGFRSRSPSLKKS
jgi:hypothetical protein